MQKTGEFPVAGLYSRPQIQLRGKKVILEYEIPGFGRSGATLF
jgi:hypothetical protein